MSKVYEFTKNGKAFELYRDNIIKGYHTLKVDNVEITFLGNHSIVDVMNYAEWYSLRH